MRLIATVKDRVLSVSMIFAQIMIALMTLLVAVEVIMRWCFRISTMVSTDFAAYGMGIVFYWAGCQALEDDVFVRMDVLYDIYKGNLKKVLNVIYDLILLFFNSVIFYYFFILLENTFERNLRATNIYQTPLWIPRLLMLIGIALFEVYLICRTAEDVCKEPDRWSNSELRKLEDVQANERESEE